MTDQEKMTIDAQILELEGQISGDMFKDMELRDKIHNLKMTLQGVRPMNSDFECVGCGS